MNEENNVQAINKDLLSFVERIERINDDIDDLRTDRKNVLDEAKEVSVGMLFNLSGRAGVAIRSIALRQAQIKAVP